MQSKHLISRSKPFMISNSLYHRNFQTKTDMKVKFCFYAKLCTQNKILVSENLKYQTTKDFRFCASYLEKVDYRQFWNRICFADFFFKFLVFSRTGYCFQGKFWTRLKSFLCWANPGIKKSSAPGIQAKINETNHSQHLEKIGPKFSPFHRH